MSTWHIGVSRIKSKALRRTAIVVAFVPLLLMNLLLHIVAVVILAHQNQIALFKTAAHYWRTDEKFNQDEDQ